MKREARTPTTVARDGLSRLADTWVTLSPDRTVSDYMGLVSEMGRDNSLRGDELANQFAAIAGSANDSETISGAVYMIIIATAYYVQAIRSEKTGLISLAWALSTDAQYWTGLAVSALAAETIPAATKTQAARKAASVRHKEDNQMKDEVIEWAKENRHKYKSLDALAEAIARDVVPLSFRAVRNHLKGL